MQQAFPARLGGKKPVFEGTMNWIVARSVLLLSLTCIAFPEIRTVQSPTQGIIFSQLESDDWRQRRDAYKQLLATSKAVGAGQTKAALIALLDKENRIRHRIMQESKEKISVSDKLGEDYSEYYADLLGQTAKVADFVNKHDLGVLLNSSFNANSSFGKRLASQGEAIVPNLLQLAQADTAVQRADAMDMLLETAQMSQLSSTTRDSMRKALIKGSQDQSVIVRLGAIRGLGRLGGRQDIPLLETIAREDPASYPLAKGGKRFPVREAAQRALVEIKSREARLRNTIASSQQKFPVLFKGRHSTCGVGSSFQRNKTQCARRFGCERPTHRSIRHYLGFDKDQSLSTA